MKTINTSAEKLVESSKAAEELRHLDPSVARGRKTDLLFSIFHRHPNLPDKPMIPDKRDITGAYISTHFP